MSFNDVVTDGQPQTHALAALLGSHEGLEDTLQDLWVNSGSVVLDLEDEFGGRLESRAEPQVSTPRHRVNGIDHQRQDHLLDLSRIALQTWQSLAEVQVQLDAIHLQLVRHQPDAAIHDRIQIGRLHVHLRSSREGQKILDQISAAAAFTRNQLKALLGLFLLRRNNVPALHPTLEQLCVSQYAREWIIDLVRDHGGHLADRRHLLDLEYVGVRALQFPCLFVDPVLERLGPRNNLFIRCPQLQAHAIEGGCQL